MGVVKNVASKTITINDVRTTGNIVAKELMSKSFGPGSSLSQRLHELSHNYSTTAPSPKNTPIDQHTILNDRLFIHNTKQDLADGNISAVMIKASVWESLVASANQTQNVNSINTTDTFLIRNFEQVMEFITNDPDLVSPKTNKFKNNASTAVIKSFSGVVPASPFEFDVGEVSPTLTLSGLNHIFDVALGTHVDFDGTGPYTITRQAGNWNTDGVVVGTKLTVSTASVSANNGIWVVLSVDTALQVTVDGPLTTSVTDVVASINAELRVPTALTNITQGLITFSAKDEADVISGTYTVGSAFNQYNIKFDGTHTSDSIIAYLVSNVHYTSVLASQ